MSFKMQVTTFPDRPGYERTSSSLWKQREVYCAILIQQAWREHHKDTVKKGSEARSVVSKNEGTKNQDAQPKGGKVTEVQPSPSPQNQWKIEVICDSMSEKVKKANIYGESKFIFVTDKHFHL